jgi:hypothetical protein
MTTADPTSKRDPSPAEAAGSGTLRTFVTLILLLHIFAVLLAAASNSSVDSSLYRRLRTALPGVRPYLQILLLDTGYTFHLTDGPPFSSEYKVTVEVRRGRGESGKRIADPGEGELVETISLGEDGEDGEDDVSWPRSRHVRVMRLKRFFAARIGTENEAVLPMAIARYVFRSRGDDERFDLLVICQQQQFTGQEGEFGPFDRMGYIEVYRGVAYKPDGGQLQILKVEQKGRVAEAESRRPGDGRRGPGSRKTPSPTDRTPADRPAPKPRIDDSGSEAPPDRLPLGPLPLSPLPEPPRQ